MALSSILLILSALLCFAFAQNPPNGQPQTFTISITNRDFEGCQYAPIPNNWQPACSHWSSGQPPGSQPACGTRNPDFEGFSVGSPYPRTVNGAVKSILGADHTPVWNNPQDSMYSTEANFNQWYHDVPGVNIDVITQATFTWTNDPGCPTAPCYVWDEGYSAGPYFPIDAKGFGNYCWMGPFQFLAPPPPNTAALLASPQCLFQIDGEVDRGGPCRQHNFHFTDQLAWDFLFVQGMFIKFNGDDDTWVFLGTELVVDLGGINWNADITWTGTSSVMSNLGLVIGQVYTVYWFHAQRKIDCSHHTMWTTIFPYCSVANDGQLCGQQAALPVCQARQCVLNQCVVANYDTTDTCPHKLGFADGMPICTQQGCLNGACNLTQPYADPACPTSSVPAGVAPECNKMTCIGTGCQSVPWFFPGTAPAVGTGPKCAETGTYDAQCWTPYCAVDTTKNAPYGAGVCTGTPSNVSPSTCPPPTAPNGKPVNPLCYTAGCAPGTGKCSTTYLNGTGGTDATQHLGNCPVPTTYDVRCYWPYCDANGQCTGTILNGTMNPYTGGWRTGTPSNSPCPLPAGYDAQCYLPACVSGVCSGFPVSGPPVNGTCTLDANTYNPQCWTAVCANGSCSQSPVNGGMNCTPLASELINTYSADCVSYSCGTGSMAGKCIPEFLSNTTTCASSPVTPNTCSQNLCLAGICSPAPVNVGSLCTGANSPPTCNTYQCVLDDTTGTASCNLVPITPPVNGSMNCTPAASDIVNTYSADCVQYECGTGDMVGKCVPNVLSNTTTCDSSPVTPDACSQNLCLAGVCTATAINIDGPCNGTDAAPSCNTWTCVLNETTATGQCTIVPATAGSPCTTDTDLCTTQSCVVDATTGLGVCNVSSVVTCNNASISQCLDPGTCVPTTGLCSYPAMADFTPCWTPSNNDTYCQNYTCYNANCIRMCACGNGILDAGEQCDWGTDAWCPPSGGPTTTTPANGTLGNNVTVPSSASAASAASISGGSMRQRDAPAVGQCPAGTSPGNDGQGNGLGLADSRSWCNNTCFGVPPSGSGLSGAAIGGITAAAVVGAAALAAAGFVAYRVLSSPAGAGPASAGGDSAAGESADNPLYMGHHDHQNPLFA